MDNQVDMVKRAFLMASEGYLAAMDETLNSDKVAGVRKSLENKILAEKFYVELAPMAAEIYRQMNRHVMVTVKDSSPKFADKGVDQLRDALRNLGYKGVITTGDVSYHFPEDDKPVIVELEKEEEAGCGHQ